MTTTHWLQLTCGLLLMALGTWAAAFRLRLGISRRVVIPMFIRAKRQLPPDAPVTLVQEIKLLPRWLWIGVCALAIGCGMALTSELLLKTQPEEFSTNFPYTELAVPVQRPGSS